MSACWFGLWCDSGGVRLRVAMVYNVSLLRRRKSALSVYVIGWFLRQFQSGISGHQILSMELNVKLRVIFFRRYIDTFGRYEDPSRLRFFRQFHVTNWMSFPRLLQLPTAQKSLVPRGFWSRTFWFLPFLAPLFQVAPEAIRSSSRRSSSCYRFGGILDKTIDELPIKDKTEITKRFPCRPWRHRVIQPSNKATQTSKLRGILQRMTTFSSEKEECPRRFRIKRYPQLKPISSGTGGWVQIYFIEGHILR